MGSTYDGSRNAEVWITFYGLIEEALEPVLYGRSVHDPPGIIADATNLEKRARERVLSIGREVGVPVHAFVFTNTKQAIERNQNRDGDVQGDLAVPDEAMVVMARRYEEMLRDIPFEPFDSITYVEKTF